MAIQELSRNKQLGHKRSTWLGELKLTRIVVAHRPETIVASGRVIRLGESLSAPAKPLIPA
jgi:hypothetical protein